MVSSYTVSGMTCNHCVAHVTEEVSSIAGVDEVKVDLGSGQMIVTSNAPVPFDQISAAVAEAGDYSVAAN
jgi:copper chaperone CopZ